MTRRQMFSGVAGYWMKPLSRLRNLSCLAGEDLRMLLEKSSGAPCLFDSFWFPASIIDFCACVLSSSHASIPRWHLVTPDARQTPVWNDAGKTFDSLPLKGDWFSMSLPRVFFPRFSLVACLFLLTIPGMASTPAASPAAVSQIVEHVDEGRLVTLSGNTRPEARAEFDRGPVAPGFVMPGMLLILRRSPERQAAFDAFVASQYDSNSPNFHRWLTSDEVGEKYGPAQADIDTVSSWLLNHGFTVDEVSKNRLTIRFSGTATVVEATFHTKIHNLQVKGEDHIANMSDPKIPEALTPVVVGVEALHNFFPHPLHRMGAQVRRDSQTGKWERISAPVQAPSETLPVKASSSKMALPPQFGTGGTTSGLANIEDVAPYDFATIYNVLPAWNANINGAGQTIAIVGTSDINPADVTAFRSAFGLPPYSAPTGSTPGFSVIHPNTAPGDCSTGASSCINDLVENSLDVEWSGAIAPKASIVLVASSPGTGSTYTSDPVYISSDYVVQHNTATIMNVSYGQCELFLGATANAAYNTLWQTASSQGIAVFVATGDSGSASCDAGGDEPNGPPYGAEFGLSVSGVASTPYNTAVGGTDFNWDWASGDQAKYWGTSDSTSNLSNALGYIPEFPWNSTCANPLLVAALNTNNKVSYTATEWCDYIGTGQITFQNEQDAQSWVDTVGGSGGKSSCINGDGSSTASCSQGYPKPSWQTALTPADTVRDIPDVSFFAANGFSGSAYVICVSVAGSCSYTAGAEPVGEEVGGTSVASPIMAAVMALVNQKTGASQGNPNTILYQLAGKETYSACSSETVTASSTSCVFNDIDTGTNAVPCAVGSPDCSGSDAYGVLTGNAASTGYDLATGLGSLNVANFVNSFASAVAPAVTLAPTSLTFASTLVGQASPVQTVTLTNSGSGDLAISKISLTGTDASDFALDTTVPASSTACSTTASVAAGASCIITVQFDPAATGTLTASLSVTDNASGSPQTVSLTGTGTVPAPVISLTPTSLIFASTLVGQSDATQVVSVKNTGTAALTISGISITGTNASSFSETNTCGAGLGINATCSITVGFKPTAAGSLSAAVSIAGNVAGSIALSGSATTPTPTVSLSPTSLTFASTTEGTAAATQAITVKNTGTAPLIISAVSITGTNASSFTQTSPSCTTVAINGTCTITVTFTPTTFGSLSASVSIADNAANTPQTVSLSGTGLEIGTYALTASAPAAVAPGSPGSSTITATPSGSYTGVITLKCSVAPITGGSDVPTCSAGSAITVTAGAATGTVTVNTTAPSTLVRKISGKTAQLKTKGWLGAGGVALACVLLFGIPARKRTWRSLLGALIFMAALGALSGCGGGGGGTVTQNDPGTTPGAYTVTVTGTDAASVVETTTFTLTVN